MTQSSSGLRGAFILCVALWGTLALLPYPLSAQEDDPGLIRTLQTDSPSVENTYYFLASSSNDTSPYQGFYLYGEG
ncbi:MAG TPA: hypothetical protein VIJ93_05695, partial [bacterium]